MNMNNCCYAPRGVFILSEGTRLCPLNPYSARNYFEKGGFCEEEIFADDYFCDLASAIAGHIYLSKSHCMADRFLCFIEDNELDEAYDIITAAYKERDKNVPLGARAAATLPDVWAIFCEMIADELELLCEYPEDIEDEEDEEYDG